MNPFKTRYHTKSNLKPTNHVAVRNVIHRNELEYQVRLYKQLIPIKDRWDKTIGWSINVVGSDL